MTSVTAIPHNLELTIDFVNTVDTDVPMDALNTTEGLSEWLAEQGVLQAGAQALTETERRAAVALRGALRTLMLANNGEPTAQGAAGELERAARRGELGVHFGADGGVAVRAAAGGLAGALAQLLVPIADAAHDGTWQRVKACRASDCHWAFYDRSRNRSGVWCDMAVCGNRTKVRTFRSRAESTP